jgi:acyl dehydratase
MPPPAYSPEELEARVGTHLGYSGWHQVTQEQVNLFADATGDHQWIHTDAVRARGGPFGTTIAHGYFTLSLLPALLGEVLEVKGPRFAVNYGINRLRFPAPVPVGSKLRLGVALEQLESLPGDAGSQVVLKCTFETAGSTKASCVADVVFRYYD